MGQGEDVEGALREIGGKPEECSVPKPKQNSISRSREGQMLRENGKWPLYIETWRKLLTLQSAVGDVVFC